jgi:hypothetical protein
MIAESFLVMIRMDEDYIKTERESLNPSSRPMTSRTFDRGSDEADLTEKEVEEFIDKSKGSILVHLLIEDCCYTIFEGNEQDLKAKAIEILLESSDNSELRYYHNGKRTSLKIEIEI